MKAWKIQHLLLSLFVIMGLMVAGFLLRESLRLQAESRAITWLSEANHLADYLLKAAATEAKERGFTATALGNPAAVTVETREKIRQLRAEGDGEMDKALALAKHVSAAMASDPLRESLRVFDERHLQIDSARKEVDRAFDSKTTTILPTTWVKTVTDVIDAGAELRRSALASERPFDRAYRNNLQIKETVFQASEFAGRERALIGAVISGAKPLTQEERTRLERCRSVVETNLAILESLVKQAPEGSALRKAHFILNAQFLGEFQQLREQVLKASDAQAPYPVSSSEWVMAATRGIDSILAMTNVVSDETAQVVSAAGQEQIRAMSALALAGLVVLAVFLLAGWLVHVRIIGPLKQLSVAAQHISRGDLGHPIAVGYQDELGELAGVFEQMRQQLSQVIEHVRGAALSLSVTTKQINSGTVMMTQSTDRQVASTQEASSAISEISASLQSVASNIAHANQKVSDAVKVAQDGRGAIDHTIDGMTKIHQTMAEVSTVMARLGQSSAEIGAIVELIDDIAKQTNLLALNATIEAARAGENGRGFAVVADEVRQLAKRSAEATGDIGKLIGTIQDEMQRAVESTRRGEDAITSQSQHAATTGETLRAIVQSVEQVGTLMEEASVSIDEQGVASGQIVHAAASIYVAAQESSEGTSSIAAMTGELQSQSMSLLDAIAFFKTLEGPAADRRELQRV